MRAQWSVVRRVARRRGRLLGAVLTVLCGGLACSRSAGEGGTTLLDAGSSVVKASCDKSLELGICVDLLEPSFALGEDFQRSACTGTRGVYRAIACDEAERVGTCDLGHGQLRRYIGRGEAPHTPASAQEDCRRVQGAWSAQRGTVSGR